VATGAKRPTPGAANRIASLWCELTGKHPDYLPKDIGGKAPTVRRLPGQATGVAIRAEIPGLESNDEAPQSYAQLQSIVMVWAQITCRYR
jgi:hypothetical protein